MSEGDSVTAPTVAQREMFPEPGAALGPSATAEAGQGEMFPPPDAEPARIVVSATCPRCDYARAIDLDGLGKVQCCACGEIHRVG